MHECHSGILPADAPAVIIHMAHSGSATALGPSLLPNRAACGEICSIVWMKLFPIVWGTLVGVFLAAVCTASAMMLPPGPRTRFLEPELAASIGVAAAVTALAVGLVIVVVRPPSRQGFAATAETCAVTVGILHALIFGYRLVVGAEDERGFAPDVVHVWLAYAAAASVLVAVFAVRAGRVRRSLTVVGGTDERMTSANTDRRERE